MEYTFTGTPTDAPSSATLTIEPTSTPTETSTAVAGGASKVLAGVVQQGAPPSVCVQYGFVGQDCTTTTYYHFGSQRVALREQTDGNTNGAVYWLHGDHLGSASFDDGCERRQGGRVALQAVG